MDPSSSSVPDSDPPPGVADSNPAPGTAPEAPPAPRPGRTRRRRWAWLIVGCVLLALPVGGYVYFFPEETKRYLSFGHKEAGDQSPLNPTLPKVQNLARRTSTTRCRPFRPAGRWTIWERQTS
jgi:hypothetical protein